jgi:Fic family protein
LPAVPPEAAQAQPEAVPARPGGWASALKLDGLPTQDVAAVEYANLLACYDAEPGIAATFFEQPLAAFDRLAVEIGRGLVDPGSLGRLRRSSQSISDGAQGRVLYHGPEPDRLPALLEELGGWLRSAAAGMPTVAVAAVVHERLLQWQPYEAGNGRVARAASRVVLRARGLDPDGVAVPEEALARDALGYYAEVAATQRRRGDLSRWAERCGEALADALGEAAAALGVGPSSPATRGLEVLAALAPGEDLTLPDYALRRRVSLATARQELRDLTASGRLVREPGTQSLRYRAPVADRP